MVVNNIQSRVYEILFTMIMIHLKKENESNKILMELDKKEKIKFEKLW